MKCYSVKQAAEVLSMSYAGVRNLLRDGRIVGFDVGSGSERMWRISEDALIDFIALNSSGLVTKDRKAKTLKLNKEKKDEHGKDG